MTSVKEAKSWWAGKKIMVPDMTHSRIDEWVLSLDQYRRPNMDILEIGSAEGQSAIFWLNFFPDCKLTCIDWFQGSEEHEFQSDSPFVIGLESRFDANTAEYGERVRKLAMHSARGLGQLVEESLRFDLIYVDGAHERDAVMADTLLCWQMLRTDGIIIWDDYEIDRAEENTPKKAVDTFLQWHADELTAFHTVRLPGQKNVQQLWAIRKERSVPVPVVPVPVVSIPSRTLVQRLLSNRFWSLSHRRLAPQPQEGE